MKHLSLLTLLLFLLCSCVPGAAIRERNRLAGLNDAMSEINALDIERYILLNEGNRYREANLKTTARYQTELSLAQSPEEGAAIFGDFMKGLEANREKFLADVNEAMKMAGVQRLTGKASLAINEMADTESALAVRTFEIFKENELPRLLAEAAAAQQAITEYQKKQAMDAELAKVRLEAERKKLEEEFRPEEPHVEEKPPASPPPLNAPDNTTTDNTGA